MLERKRRKQINPGIRQLGCIVFTQTLWCIRCHSYTQQLTDCGGVEDRFCLICFHLEIVVFAWNSRIDKEKKYFDFLF